ncbi:MAG: M23 family metallopeptidase, partial [Rhodospirillaceae bacterium]|nr:M23 family metallopeptidase [Rhodospirillaceae bacterium]
PGAAPLSAGVSTGVTGAATGAVAASTAAGAIAEQALSTPVAVQPLPSPQPVAPSAPLSAEVVTPAPPPLAPQPVAPALSPEAPRETNVASLPPQRPAVPASTSGAQFTWPVNGAILARFGAAGKGLHNDGINIAAPAGTQVRAAGNGVVAYAGNELKGFGNLLLIKHADGWTTAYAHNDKLLVAKGDTVVQGQVIAVVGRTGNVDRPQLHFEVRKGTQAMDPMAYLAK